MFRWLTLLVVVGTVGISAYYRHRARQSGRTIERRREGARVILLRVAIALPLFASVVAFVLHPRWMAWSELNLPLWQRWVGAVLGGLAIPAAWWVFRSLGRNVSETVLTKNDHELVTSGPYRWLRHPLYSTGGMLFIGVGLMAANWFILLFAVLAVVLTRLIAIPLEERALLSKFGDEYRTYMRRTGRMVPRLPRRT